MGTGTGIGRVRGLGSARHGTQHWIQQRVTAAASVLLVVWFLISLLRLPGFAYGEVREWLAQPLVAVPMILMVANLFWHLRLGLQVVIEDYVHEEGAKFGTILLLNFYAVAGAACGIFAIAKIAFSAGAAS
jgi:succinate dehydrogenase / fumarate reductase membrane anchor subunit